MSSYPMVIFPLSDEDGGGFMACFPDLPGCMSDGETYEEAAANALDAFDCWMETQKERGVEIPAPDSAAEHAIGRVNSLAEAVKALMDYTEVAEDHIVELENALRNAIDQLDNDWRKSGAIISAKTKAKTLIAVH